MSSVVRLWLLTVAALIFVTLLVGGVTRLRAGLIYDTWPLIAGALVPERSRLLFQTPLWRNALTVQLDHRMVAYALWLFALLHAVDVARTTRGGVALTSALVLAATVTFQAALGVVTLLHQAPLALALTHQAVAIVVLAIAVVHAERLEWRHELDLAAAPGEATVRSGERAT
jgi:cytochrome c oxidase assembly protein subunit 15